MRQLENYHLLNPDRRYEVVYEWDIGGHKVAYGYKETDWENGVTHRHSTVFCECDVTCTIINGTVSTKWGGDCDAKQKVYELGIEGARERYTECWAEMDTDDAIYDILTRVANNEWLGQKDRHIYPQEVQKLLRNMPEQPDDIEITQRYRLMAVVDRIKNISNYWYYVDPEYQE